MVYVKEWYTNRLPLDLSWKEMAVISVEAPSSRYGVVEFVYPRAVGMYTVGRTTSIIDSQESDRWKYELFSEEEFTALRLTHT